MDQLEREATKIDTKKPNDPTILEVKSLFDTITNIFSSNVLATYFGIGALEERVEGLQINQYALQSKELARKLSVDPLVILFGIKFYLTGIKKDYKLMEEKRKNFITAGTRYVGKVSEIFKNKPEK